MNRPTSQASVEENDANVLRSLKEYSTLEHHIRKMEQELQNLKNTQGEKIDYINRHSRLLSPVRRIPIEIQQIIFEYAVYSSGDSGTRVVLTIASVCKQWRNDAIKMPSLWAHLRFTLPTHPLPHRFSWQVKGHSQDLQRKWLDPGLDQAKVAAWNSRVGVLLEFAKTFATRSGSYPITLTFDATNIFVLEGPRAISLDMCTLTSKMLDRFVLSNEPLKRLISSLCQLKLRLRDVNLSIPCVTPSSSLLDFLKVLNRKESPQLRNVEIMVDTTELWIPDPNASHIPALRHPMEYAPSMPYPEPLCPSFSLKLPSWNWRFWGLPIMWSGLTSLTFIADALDASGLETPVLALKFGVLLRSCPNLEYCSFALPSVMIDGDEGPHHLNDFNDPSPRTLRERGIHLPRLKTLEIEKVCNLPLGFAELLELPQLRELTLFCNPWTPVPREAVDSPLVEFIKRFGRGLTSATIDYSHLTQAALEECLEHLPNVSFLALEGGCVDTMEVHDIGFSDVLTKMNGAGADNTLLCPKLETFHYGLGPGASFQVDGSLEFITPRRPKLDVQRGGGNARSVGKTFLQKVVVRTYVDDQETREKAHKEVKSLLINNPGWVDLTFDLRAALNA